MMLGISTHCLMEMPLENALSALDNVCDVVEIMNDGMHHIENPEIPLVFDYEYFMHAPSRSVNIASHLEPIRRGSVKVISETIEIAAYIDAGGVVFHPGYFAWERDRDVAVFQLQKSLLELKALSEEYSVPLFAENMTSWPYFFLRTPEDLPLITDFGFVLDVGHANLNSCLDDFLQAEISHFHLHDNYGTEDDHFMIGKGNINFEPVYDAVRKNDCSAIIEVGSFEGAKRSYNLVKKKLGI